MIVTIFTAPEIFAVKHYTLLLQSLTFMAKGSLRFAADPYNEVVKHSYIAKMEKPRQTLATIELLELIINGLQSWVFM